MIGLLQAPKPFYGDSGEYWSLTDSFTKGAHFSLLNFESPLRGYALSLMLYFLRKFEGSSLSPSTLATIFNVVIFALIGSVLAPRLAEVAWPGHRWRLGRRVTLMALLMIFWSGDLNYPLSDFPGLAMALLTLVAIARPESLGMMLTAGIGAGLAINTRPAYLLLLPMLVLILGWEWFDRQGTAHASRLRRGICVAFLLLGFAVISLPQSLAAHRHQGTWNPIPGATPQASASRLTAGLAYVRADTYDGAAGPSSVVYDDASGRELMDKEPGRQIANSGEYMNLVVNHPIAIAASLARHLINGLDARYSTIYVEHLAGGGHLGLRISGFALIFLALLRLCWPAARRSLGTARWRYPIALALCCATALTTSAETRYMLPLDLLSYVLVLMPGWPNPIDSSKVGLRRFRTVVAISLAALVFTAGVWNEVRHATGHVVFAFYPSDPS